VLLYNIETGLVKPGSQENCAFSAAGFGFTLLPDMFARTKRFIWDETIEKFAAQCRGTRAPSKSELPLGFAGKLGREPTNKGVCATRGTSKR
jgi:hypothetical protein